MTLADGREPRALCARCGRPAVVCYCRFVTPLVSRTRVVILQHPRERYVPINTARIASLCLPEAELHVGLSFDGLSALSDAERPAVLLYPGDGAIDVEKAHFEGPRTLVVVDGTWWQAKSLIGRNPALRNLPRVAFRPKAPSAYRIRREPALDYVSTVEALAHVLGVLDGEPEKFLALLEPFRAMVESQLAYAAQSGGSRHRRSPRKSTEPPKRRGLPSLLHEGDLVCVHAEANAWPYSAGRRGACPDEVVQWSAVRLPEREAFQAFVAPRGPLNPATAIHLEVDAARIVAGETFASFHERWRRFLRPTDAVCRWGTYTHELLNREHPSGTDAPLRGDLDLRPVARAFARGPVGTMSDFAVRLGVTAQVADAIDGRAKRRLGELAAITTELARLSRSS